MVTGGSEGALRAIRSLMEQENLWEFLVQQKQNKLWGTSQRLAVIPAL